MPTRIVSHRSFAGAFADPAGRAFSPPPGGLEASGPEAEDQAFMTAYLGDALRAIEDAETLPGVMVAPGHQLASLMQSYLAENPEAAVRIAEQPLPGGGVEVKYDSGDLLGWSKSVFSWWRRIRKQPWRRPNPVPEALGTGTTARIALLADWGTGLYGAVRSADAIAADPRGFDLLLHLGDVYYSGTRREVRDNFLAHWPRVPGAISRALNSNHEMYCGGDGLFNETLPAFGQAATTCALQNDDWLLVGLDSGYDDHDLHGEQAAWLDALLADAADRRVVLFSHHQPYSLLDSQGPKLVAKLARVLTGRRIFAWYWGHEHRCVLYDPHPVWGLHGRCIGHGGFPAFRDQVTAYPADGGDVRWRRLAPRNLVPGGLLLDGENPYVENHAADYSPHGYVTLELDGPRCHEVICAPDGTPVRARQLA
jgi:hypothetical protein